MKDRYDAKHKAISFKVGNQVYLQLYKGYRLNTYAPRKLTYQRTNPIVIKRVVNNLAYKLELPPTMKIYLVVSVAQLEPATKGVDPYSRPKHVVYKDVQTDQDALPFTLIESILAKKVVDSKLLYLVNSCATLVDKDKAEEAANKKYCDYYGGKITGQAKKDVLRDVKRIENRYSDHTTVMLAAIAAGDLTILKPYETKASAWSDLHPLLPDYTTIAFYVQQQQRIYATF
ncbi:hypothetical protein B0A54_16392 [Friedmanniomyces endolithicus]|uniref:Uncharacterized protein n=1 Tax=Friedmanniomyces endolithicus TaxID=329885 RepID=A0A4U0U0K9_9PEZI|nr:hypothetical protein B0A54_16392 [Friedmanniomyces endolithicus]